MESNNIQYINEFINKYGNSKSIMNENIKSLKEAILFYNTHSYDEFKKEYPLCHYTYEEMQYFLKCCRKSYRSVKHI